jgi:hypothetical protein
MPGEIALARQNAERYIEDHQEKLRVIIGKQIAEFDAGWKPSGLDGNNQMMLKSFVTGLLIDDDFTETIHRIQSQRHLLEGLPPG